MNTDQNFQVLIAPKKLKNFSATDFHTYVKEMFRRRAKKISKSAKPKSPVEGISISKTKRGVWSIRRTKARSFAYILDAEMKSLAAHYKLSYAEVWNLFKSKSWIITRERLEAERIYAELQEIPW